MYLLIVRRVIEELYVYHCPVKKYVYHLPSLLQPCSFSFTLTAAIVLLIGVMHCEDTETSTIERERSTLLWHSHCDSVRHFVTGRERFGSWLYGICCKHSICAAIYQSATGWRLKPFESPKMEGRIQLLFVCICM